MSRNTHVFGWDEEPADERPSEFMHSTLGSSAFSGYHVPREMAARYDRRRRGSGWGLGGVVVAFVLLIALSGLAFHQLARLLHA
jgi:hypothetical protein